jgi:ATP-binding cassette subfamily B protein
MNGRQARPAGSGRAVWRALGYLRRYRGETVGALIALVCVSAANLGAPQMVRFAIDGGLQPRRWSGG